MKDRAREVVEAATRWRLNMLECRRLPAEFEPCEEQEDPGYTHDPDDPPCWKVRHYAELDPPEFGSPPSLCPACTRNSEGVLPRLRAARARRGAYSSALAKAVDRLVAEHKGRRGA